MSATFWIDSGPNEVARVAKSTRQLFRQMRAAQWERDIDGVVHLRKRVAALTKKFESSQEGWQGAVSLTGGRIHTLVPFWRNGFQFIISGQAIRDSVKQPAGHYWNRALIEDGRKPLDTLPAKPKMVYVIGSLLNPQIPVIANTLREAGFEVFDDWFAAGPGADDAWRDYEKGRGHTYAEALRGYAARHVFAFDKAHLERADAVVLALPAGRSGHLELGWALGKGKPGFVLLDSPERWDVMYQFATGVVETPGELVEALRNGV